MNTTKKYDTVNQQLEASQQEIQELKDLCCYLHDERAKLINLVSEWKKFGKHIFGTMQVQKEAFYKELSSLKVEERQLLREVNEMRELISNMAVVDPVRKGGDGSSSPSPILEKVDLKRNEIYMRPRDAISTPSSLDGYSNINNLSYVPSYQSSDYASLATINAYNVKKFHHSMPRGRVTSHSTIRSSFGSDNMPYNKLSDNVPFTKLPDKGPYTNLEKRSFTNVPDKGPFTNLDKGPYTNIDKGPFTNLPDNANVSNNLSTKFQNNMLSEEERAMYRNMCKSVWKNLGNNTVTYKTAV